MPHLDYLWRTKEPLLRLRRARTRRRMATTAALLTIGLVGLASPASAAPHMNYSSSGVFWSGGGQGATWAHQYITWSQNDGGIHRVHFKLGGYSHTCQGAYCLTDLNLPANQIQLVTLETVMWNGTTWAQYAVNWPNPINNGASTSVASYLVADGIQPFPAWYYTRSTAKAFLSGAWRSYTSGAEQPAVNINY
ncbi:MAG TPA: hypothetical protein PLS46_01330 [Microthrixaceae bacterium]|nr:hypothetical protein [Microthrixaceae bacterium]